MVREAGGDSVAASVSSKMLLAIIGVVNVRPGWSRNFLINMPTVMMARASSAPLFRSCRVCGGILVTKYSANEIILPADSGELVSWSWATSNMALSQVGSRQL